MRNTRVAAAAAAARLVRLGRDALAAWMVLGAARKARLQEDNLLRLNVSACQRLLFLYTRTHTHTGLRAYTYTGLQQPACGFHL